MNIQTVAENLRNTIAGKEELLKHIRAKMLYEDVTGNVMANRATHDFLEINIGELKRILQDVEKCCEKTTYDSWKENPDRMGGQFTDEEISRANEWR
jgi:hypothetical protein